MHEGSALVLFMQVAAGIAGPHAPAAAGRRRGRFTSAISAGAAEQHACCSSGSTLSPSSWVCSHILLWRLCTHVRRFAWESLDRLTAGQPLGTVHGCMLLTNARHCACFGAQVLPRDAELHLMVAWATGALMSYVADFYRR